MITFVIRVFSKVLNTLIFYIWHDNCKDYRQAKQLYFENTGKKGSKCDCQEKSEPVARKKVSHYRQKKCEPFMQKRWEKMSQYKLCLNKSNSH
ncbi:MAG TPA: hypothetical protein VFC58_13945, partial [Desulfosporosinus sp.]|nr:hypothetical protein [Desulfosporosinus sp.]